MPKARQIKREHMDLSSAIRFMREPVFDKANLLSNVYYRAKGAFIYRMFFGHFGKGSLIRSPIFIKHPRFISIGNHVFIRDGARLEIVYTGDQPDPGLHIGDRTNIEQGVHIVCHRKVWIGSEVSIAGHCCIVDVTHPYDDINETTKIGLRIKSGDAFVNIGDGAFIGFGAVILPNVTVGRRAIVGANSVVVRDVPEFCVAAGAPARIIKRYDFNAKTWVNADSKE